MEAAESIKKKMLKWYIVLWTAYCISFTAVEHVNQKSVWHALSAA